MEMEEGFSSNESDQDADIPVLVENDKHKAPNELLKFFLIDKGFRSDWWEEVRTEVLKRGKCDIYKKSKGRADELWKKGKNFLKLNDFIKAYNCLHTAIRYSERCDQAFYIGERGKIFFHLDVYDLALADILYAQYNGYSKESLYHLIYFKLHIFKAINDDGRAAKARDEMSQCINEIEEESLRIAIPQILKIEEIKKRNFFNSRERYSLVGFENNPDLVNGNVGVQLKMEESTGKHLIEAIQDLPIGYFLFNEEPFCSVLHESYALTHCDHCLVGLRIDALREQLNYMYPCRNCTKVLYCSPVCERIAWMEHHRFECGNSEYLLQTESNLALRILLKAGPTRILKTFSKDKELKHSKSWKLFSTNEGTDYDRVYSLLTRVEDFTEDDRRARLVKSAQLVLFLKRRTSFFQNFNTHQIGQISEVLFHHILQIRWSGYPIYDEKDKAKSPIGLGIYPSISHLNYSRPSNTEKFFLNGRQMVICASTELKKGTEIFAPVK